MIDLTTAKSVAQGVWSGVRLWGMKNSPTILLSLGIGGSAAAAVFTGIAAYKMREVLAESDANMVKIKEARATQDVTVYSEEDYKQDLVKFYIQRGGTLAKLYGPALAAEGLSVACLIGCHSILNERNVGLMAAYATVDQAFKRYRKGVVDKLGLEVDEEFRFGPATDVLPESSEQLPYSVKRTDGYVRYFDSSNPEYRKDPDANVWFLEAQQSWANDKLHAEGFLFLNDVLSALSIPPCREGQTVGWRKGGRVNFIDFRIKQCKQDLNSEYSVGTDWTSTPVYQLEFNVDGVILDALDE